MFIREIAASLYPWDIADTGVDTCIGTLARTARVRFPDTMPESIDYAVSVCYNASTGTGKWIALA